jgi:uncharacterized membrane protein YeaQ/YmgE (transglycosylase-associated protein family)
MSPELENILIMIVVGLVAGWLAGQILKGRSLGLVGNIVVGICGSFVAAWLLPRFVALPAIGSSLILNSIVYSAIGAIILLLIVGMVRKAA